MLPSIQRGGGMTPNPKSLDVVTAETEIVSSAAESTVYTFTLPANTLGSNNMLRLLLVGSYLNNSGANRTLTVRVKLGATTLITYTTGTIATSATRKAAVLELWLKGDAATNAQEAQGRFDDLSSANTAFGASAGSGGQRGTGTSAEDATTALALTVTVQHSNSEATSSFIMKMAALELMKAL